MSHRFIKDIGCKPKTIKTDFDAKLKGQAIQIFSWTLIPKLRAHQPENKTKMGFAKETGTQFYGWVAAG